MPDHPSSLSQARPMRETRIARDAGAIAEISRSPEPVILRDFVADWPVVQAARQSDHALVDYLKRFDRGAVVPISAGPAALNGRIFYNSDFTGLNVDKGNTHFATLMDRLLAFSQAPASPLAYMASMSLDACVPGFDRENVADFGTLDPLASIWIGTQTRIAAHTDLPLNIACVAAGDRVFTLFPPDQTENLYPGPFEITPAGRPISLVDFREPDLERYPKFAAAMETAQIAHLTAGDAIFIPSMWWHHVEAVSPVNVLVNYWWRTTPAYFGTPQDVLNHAMMTLRDLPPGEKAIWKQLFDFYVFENDSAAVDHIPEPVRGILGPIDEKMTQRVTAYLLNRLNR